MEPIKYLKKIFLKCFRKKKIAYIRFLYLINCSLV